MFKNNARLLSVIYMIGKEVAKAYFEVANFYLNISDWMKNLR
jgi:hypothetical protein